MLLTSRHRPPKGLPMIHQTMSEGMTHTQEDLLMVPFSLRPGEDSRNMGAR